MDAARSKSPPRNGHTAPGPGMSNDRPERLHVLRVPVPAKACRSRPETPHHLKISNAEAGSNLQNRRSRAPDPVTAPSTQQTTAVRESAKIGPHSPPPFTLALRLRQHDSLYAFAASTYLHLLNAGPRPGFRATSVQRSQDVCRKEDRQSSFVNDPRRKDRLSRNPNGSASVGCPEHRIFGRNSRRCTARRQSNDACSHPHHAISSASGHGRILGPRSGPPSRRCGGLRSALHYPD